MDFEFLVGSRIYLAQCCRNLNHTKISFPCTTTLQQESMRSVVRRLQRQAEESHQNSAASFGCRDRAEVASSACDSAMKKRKRIVDESHAVYVMVMATSEHFFPSLWAPPLRRTANYSCPGAFSHARTASRVALVFSGQLEWPGPPFLELCVIALGTISLF